MTFCTADAEVSLDFSPRHAALLLPLRKLGMVNGIATVREIPIGESVPHRLLVLKKIDKLCLFVLAEHLLPLGRLFVRGLLNVTFLTIQTASKRLLIDLFTLFCRREIKHVESIPCAHKFNKTCYLLSVELRALVEFRLELFLLHTHAFCHIGLRELMQVNPLT